ncbi:D-alanyl-lipoteichoic acid biosynthesis protein DltB [Secundilactobacillus folii]|uniref:Teichoic acid D-alanyltransferase n=1 Tax=Secundilactobacillus folii TaxID=2678357 RepID=A0A7X3C3H2_9LACO|nr:D-alanyl-lipoteichoic acid biosynthesis protein DltB [Secundilactobacillus folii]MTV82289.1 D-alanyl-lipoteichoic acid biosynthesis protein DltB [Secundilactobacillus folii]
MINLQPYASPTYFILLIITLLPAMIALYYGRRLQIYEAVWTFGFLVLTFGGNKWHQGLALIFYVIFQLLLILLYQRYRKQHNSTVVFITMVLLSILPLVCVKLAAGLALQKLSFLGFLGISYLTFKTVQIIMEQRDGTIKAIRARNFLRFLLFFPTVSSGPIDRFRRFQADVVKLPDRDTYARMLDKGTQFLFRGFVYKYMLGYLFGTLWLPKIAQLAMAHRQAFHGLGLSWSLLFYMYDYSMYLFFDFAGYSMFAIGISYFLGIKTPQNFNAPFISHNIKDFWNRWHMSLSFWFRDFIFMRVTFFIMKKRLMKNPVRISQVAYLINFLVMGFWHGLTWYYIVYGLFHAVAIILNDVWLRFKKKHLKGLPHNSLTEGIAIFITFNTVCLSFLIFSGFLNTLWFR